MVVMHDLELEQLDVKIIFLHREWRTNQHASTIRIGEHDVQVEEITLSAEAISSSIVQEVWFLHANHLTILEVTMIVVRILRCFIILYIFTSCHMWMICSFLLRICLNYTSLSLNYLRGLIWRAWEKVERFLLQRLKGIGKVESCSFLKVAIWIKCWRGLG